MPSSLKRRSLKRLGLALALVLSSGSAWSAEKVNLVLNWTPTADHSPFYYAKAQGWYEKAGIDLTIEVGKGSGASSLKVGSGGSRWHRRSGNDAGRARQGADVLALAEHLRQHRPDFLLAQELWRQRPEGLSRVTRSVIRRLMRRG